MLGLINRACYCLTLILLSIPCIHALASSVDPARIDRMMRLYDRDNRPGVAVMVIENGETVYAKGFGMANLDHGVEITPQTVFHLASVSKQFAAFCVLLLEERGLLALDDEIHSILPDLPDFGHPVTIRQMMYHTSGIRDYFEPLLYAGWNLFTDIITPDHAMKIVSRQTRLNFTPGSNFLYSNTGYFLIERIVEEINGMTLREFAHAEIFEPLGMSNTHFDNDDYETIPNRAESYAFSENRTYRIPVHFTNSGDGGLVSTLDDLAIWDANFDQRLVGSDALFEKMLTGGSINNQPAYYGGGLIVAPYKGTTLIYHDGSLGGFRALMARFPERGISVYALSNDGSFDVGGIPFQIADIYLEAPSTSVTDFQMHEPSAGWGSGAPVWLPDEETARFNHWFLPAFVREKFELSAQIGLLQVTPSPEELDRFAGRYYSAECDAYVDIGLDAQGHIALKTLRGLEIPFTLLRRTAFQLGDGLHVGEFQADSDGVTDRFTISGSRALHIEFVRMGSPDGR